MCMAQPATHAMKRTGGSLEGTPKKTQVDLRAQAKRIKKAIRSNDLVYLGHIFNKDNINDPIDHNNFSLIHLAASYGKIGVIQFALGLDADINKQNPDQQTALMIAAEEGFWEIVSHLCACNADTNLVDHEQKNALHVAAEGIDMNEGHMACLILLMRYNTDANHQDIVNGFTPLHCACTLKNIPLILLLLQHPAINLDLQDNDGNTPLLMSLRNLLQLSDDDTADEDEIEATKKIVQILIQRGASISIANHDQETALSLMQEYHAPYQLNLLVAEQTGVVPQIAEQMPR